jgi:hypothetical protein
MSFPKSSVEYCPVRTNVDYSQIQFSDYSNQEVQVADYSKVEYFQPSDSEEDQSDEAGNGANGQSKFFFSSLSPSRFFLFFFLSSV